MRPTSWTYSTKHGTFRIVLIGQRWRAMFENEDLGAYSSPLQAAYELANGHTFWPSCGDPSTMAIPEDISDWTPASP